MADDRAQKLEETNHALEARLLELERSLMAEKEKAIEAVVRSKEGEVASANVESALKDMQDKLRREKREQELEAARHAAESKVKDLERRLAEERDMWVTMLKDHMARGGDNRVLVQEISTLKAECARKDAEITAWKEESAKGGGDQKLFHKEISALKELLAKQESALSAREDEVRLLKSAMAAKEGSFDRQSQELALRLQSLEQTLVENDAEKLELQRQAESARQEAENVGKRAAGVVSADMARDRALFQKRLKEQQEYQARLTARSAELEKEVHQRDKMLETAQEENHDLQKKVQQLTAAKDAESRLLRENLQRLGQQNKELLMRLKEMAEAAPVGPSAPDPGSVTPELQDMLGSLEQALAGRDKVLEHQQKSLDEKKDLINGLFSDLKSLDEQAVSLLEEKNRATQEMSEQVGRLSSENERLRQLLQNMPPPPQ